MDGDDFMRATPDELLRRQLKKEMAGIKSRLIELSQQISSAQMETYALQDQLNFLQSKADKL